MKSLFSILEENITSMVFIMIALMLTTFKSVGIASSYFDEIFITVLLAIILLDSLINRVRIERRIEKLSFQIADGNPNAVFRLSDQNQAFANIARNAQSDILLVGPSFVGFLSTESHIVIQSLEKGLRVRVILLDPNADTLLQHMAQSTNLKKDIEYSLSQLEKIKQLAGNLTGALEIRVSQSPLSVIGLQADGGRFDGTLLIGLYALTTTGITNGPYFVINKRTSNELFESLSRPLEMAWESSQPIGLETATSRKV